MANMTTYFEETGDSPFQLALRIGRSPSTITRALNGERNPSINLARDVHKGTKGKISAEQFIADCIAAQER